MTVNLAVDERKDATVTRIIADLQLTLTGSGTTGAMSFGMCILNLDAIAALAIPDPEIESDHPGWLWRTELNIREIDNPAWQLHLDLRSQRRFRDDDEMLSLIMSYVGTGTGVVKGWTRTLVKHRA